MDMIKIIQRPIGSKSYVVEIPFHILNDAKEWGNILHEVKPEEFILIRRMINESTFQPEILFMINQQNKNPGFYSGPVERFMDSWALEPKENYEGIHKKMIEG